MTKYISLDKERIRQAFAENPDECWAALEPICEWLSQWASSLPERDTEPPTTLIACTHCQRGVKPKYAIHGLCNNCARDLIRELWDLMNLTIETLPVSGHIQLLVDKAIDIRVRYRLFGLDE